ncbi:MAG: isopeptide-forming domain-containing fimbrial protein [Desulfofustis sp.]|nr:isopeptide-forming domain-containing fimbrial protein [Desulfofustis sp.]
MPSRPTCTIPLIEVLEDRIFFDANPAAVLIDPVEAPLDQEAMDMAEQGAVLPPLREEGAPEEQVQSRDAEHVQPLQPTPEDTLQAAPEGDAPPGTMANQQDTVDKVLSGATAAPLQDAEPGVEADPAIQEAVSAELDPDEQPEAEVATASQAEETAHDAMAEVAVEPVDPLIGEQFTFTVELDNPTANTLYGPYIDLYFESSGDDGDGDGVLFESASYLGTSLTTTELTYDGVTALEHPYAVDNTGSPITISTRPDGAALQANDTLVVLEMPFGSFTPDQPPAPVEITASISENSLVDSAGGDTYDYDVQVSNGFRYGSDALNNPNTDASVTDLNVSTQTFRPEVVRFNKDYLGPEQETATGPNYERTYTIAIDVADGQEVTNLQVREQLPNSIFYLGSVTGGTVSSGPADPGVYDGEVLVIDVGTITGGPGVDATVTFDYYVPYVDATATPIVSRTDGDDNDQQSIINDAEIVYDWAPKDPDDDPITGIVMDTEVNPDGSFAADPDNDEEFEAKAIAIQKGVGFADPDDNVGNSGYNPGDVVQYTLQFQVSDYFNVGNISITDVLPDGLDFLTAADGYGPTFAISDNYTSITGTWTYGSNLTETTIGGDDIQLVFDVSAVAGVGANGILRGTLSNVTNNSQDTAAGAPATGTITYFARIRESYDSEASGDIGGDLFIDQGDLFNNSVRIDATLYNGDPADPGSLIAGDDESDGSRAGFAIATGSVEKEVFAINGANPDPDGDGIIRMEPGDLVTYHLSYFHPTSDFEQFELVDYLPLPVLSVTGLSWSFDSTETDLSDFSTAPGTAGQVRLTNLDTFTEYTDDTTPTIPDDGLTPTISTDTGANSVSFVYGNFHTDSTQETRIDLVFTVEVSDDPFADGLFLTNQVRAIEDGTQGVDTVNDQIVQILLDQPELEITKGIIATDNASATFSDDVGPVDFSDPDTSGFRGTGSITESGLLVTPVDANLSGIDAGDLVSFGIVVQNVGHSAAFDIRVADDLPAGFAIPGTVTGLNLTVSDGAGNIYTEGVDYSLGSGFFTDGIEFINDGSDGFLASNEDTIDQSDNIIVITYDLIAESSVESLQTLTNTAAITNYAGAEGAADHTSIDPSDTAEVVTALPVVDKALVSSQIEDGTNGRDEAVIGEIITYEVEITIPEGQTSGASVIDELDSGLSFNELIAVSADGVTSSLGTLDATTVSASVSGQTITFSLGDLTNGNTNNAVPETITLVYSAYVNNNAANQSGTELTNAALVDFANGISVADSAPDVEVIEPDLEVVKTVNGSGTASADAGDTVTYTITLQHSASSETDAFDVTFSDAIPPEVEGVSLVSVTDSAMSLTTSDFTLAGNDLSLNSATDMPESRVISIVLQGTLSQNVAPGDVILNDAEVRWHSLDEAPTNADGVERTGDGSGANDYAAAGSATIAVDSVGVSKTLFSTGIVDATNENDEATIGETVTYEVEITIPEGTITDASVTDLLDPGLDFISLDAISKSLGLVTAWNDVGDIAITETGTGFTGSPQTVVFALGTMTNAGTSSTTTETVTLRYTARVLDDTAVFDGESRGNAARATWNGDRESTPASADVDIIEPWLTTLKSVTPTSQVEAGNTLSYTVALTNSGTAAAYEVSLVDTLAPGTSFASLTTATIGGADVLTGTITNDSGTSVTFSNEGWDLAVGQTLTLVYTVSVTDAIRVDGDHTNNADADWSNLDGDDPNERVYDEDDGDGPDSPVDDGDNADRDRDTAVFSIDPVTLSKTDNGATSATIGDDITYTLTLTSPQGTVADLVIEDVLGAGLIYNEDATVTTASGSFTIGAGNSLDPSFGTNDGSVPVTLTWDFGDTIVATDAPVIITYTARVANLVAVTSGDSLANSASLEYTNAQDELQQPPPVSDSFVVAEPVIETIKTIAGTADGDTATVAVGDVVQYQVVLENSGTSTAYEVTAVDTLADGTTYFTDATRLPAADIDGTPATIAVTDNTTSLSFSDGSDGWDLAPGEEVTITYYVRIGASYLDSTTTNNTTNSVDANWSNQDGTADPDERIYDDGTANPLQDVDGDQDVDSADFAVDYTGSIGDLIFFDGDDSGDFSSGDVGINNVEVTLTATLDGVTFTQTTTTAVDGSYSFANLAAFDAYVIGVTEATLPTEVVQTFDPGGPSSLDSTHTQALAAGEAVTTVDFGYTGEFDGAIGDYVWYDQNGNGLQDESGTGIAGAELTLFGDLDGDGTFEYSETTTTNVDGFYQFVNLPLETYYIEVSSLPAGFDTPTFERDGALDNRVDIAPSDWDPAAPTISDVDFGFVGSGLLGDYIWNDVNADGIQDGSETGLAGVTVTLTGDLDNDGIDEILTTATDGDGGYQFTNLPAGDFTISVDTTTLPEDFVNTTDPDGITDSQTTVTLGAGETNNDIDFGYTETGSIGDTVFYDANNDSVQNPGEAGIPGVSVTLTGDFDLDGTVDTLVTTTDSSGSYLFDDLLPGTYTVTIDPSTLPGGVDQTYDLDGLASPDAATLTLVAGEDNRAADFGYTGTGAIGDQLWVDGNGNGFFDAGETVLPGVSVTIGVDLNGDGTPDFTETTTTDGSGQYLFTNLPAGSHTITIDPATLPSGLRPSVDPDGMFDNTTIVTLGPGEINRSIDFGYVPSPPPEAPKPPVSPLSTPSPPSPPADGFVFDNLFRSYVGLTEPSGLDDFFTERQWAYRDEIFQEILVPVAPIYSGHAEPGTTLRIVLYDSQGNEVGEQTIMADAGGNWLSNFSGTMMMELPHEIRIEQTMSLYNASTPGGFNLRTYFAPYFGQAPFSTGEASVESIFATLPESIFQSLNNHQKRPLALSWDNFYAYEFFAPSTNPGQNRL